MSDNTDLLSLDDLFKEAKRTFHETKRKEEARTKGKPVAPDKPRPSELYTNPENWIKGRGIALIHSETQTLLGNFHEFLHRTVGGVRRLVRAEEPIAVSAAEYVTGEWGAPASPVLDHQDSTLREIELTVQVHLQFPAMTSHRAVPLRVITQGAGILRIELREKSSFFADGELLELPGGTNILQVLSRETKTRIHQELSA